VYCVALSFTRPHKSSSLQDPPAQTNDGDIHSDEPPLFSSSGFTPHRVATAWAQGYVKDQVYVPPLPASIPELKVRIRTAIETITANMRNELDYRVDVCRITKGSRIERL